MNQNQENLIKSLVKAVDLGNLKIGTMFNKSQDQKIYHEIKTDAFTKESPITNIESYLKMDRLNVSNDGKVTFIKLMDDDISIESIFFNNTLEFIIVRGNIILYESEYTIDTNNRRIIYRHHDKEVQQGPFTLTDIIADSSQTRRFINPQNLKLWFDTIEEVRSFVFTFISMFYEFLSKPSRLNYKTNMKEERELNFGLYKIYPNQKYSSPELVKRYVKYFEEYRPKNVTSKDDIYGIIKVVEPSKSVGSRPLVLYSLSEGDINTRLEQALTTNNNELATTIFNQLIHQPVNNQWTRVDLPSVSGPGPVRALVPVPAPAPAPLPPPPTAAALAALKLPEENELWGDIAMRNKYMKYKMKYLALKKTLLKK